jgi:hypothetical protein
MSRQLQGLTIPGRQLVRATKFCVVAPNTFGSSVWNLFLVPRILMWFVDFWNIFGHSDCCVDVTDLVLSEYKGFLYCIYHKSGLSVV